MVRKAQHEVFDIQVTFSCVCPLTGDCIDVLERLLDFETCLWMKLFLSLL
jgi:hypothetical protein